MMRNPDAKHLDCAELVGLIPTNPKLLPSNLDMVYERRGHFLLCEWKREGESVSRGQEILLCALAAQPSFIVLLVTGDTDDGMRVSSVAQLSADGSIRPKGTDVDDLKSLISRWYLWVEMKCGGRYAASI
jgi:hypothetical protein